MTTLDNNQQQRMADKIAQIDRLCARARIMPVITIMRESASAPLRLRLGLN